MRLTRKVLSISAKISAREARFPQRFLRRDCKSSREGSDGLSEYRIARAGAKYIYVLDATMREKRAT